MDLDNDKLFNEFSDDLRKRFNIFINDNVKNREIKINSFTSNKNEILILETNDKKISNSINIKKLLQEEIEKEKDISNIDLSIRRFSSLIQFLKKKRLDIKNEQEKQLELDEARRQEAIEKYNLKGTRFLIDDEEIICYGNLYHRCKINVYRKNSPTKTILVELDEGDGEDSLTWKDAIKYIKENSEEGIFNITKIKVN